VFEAVILAAGYSSRAGSNKMMFDIDGKPVLSHTIEAFLPVCDKVVVVGGHYYNEIESIVSQYDSVQLVKNKNYQMGMFSSILCGMSFVEHQCFVCPGDYPLINNGVVRKLMEVKGDFCVPKYKGKRGHPVLLSKESVDRLKTWSRNSNLKLFRDTCHMV